MNESVLQIRVACYAGYRGDEEPRRLWFDNRSVEVAEILDRWLAQDHSYFKIRGDDGYIYIVRNDTTTGADDVESDEPAGSLPMSREPCAVFTA